MVVGAGGQLGQELVRCAGPEINCVGLHREQLDVAEDSRYTPAKRGKGANRLPYKEAASSAERHAAMTWAQRLKRVFSIDIEVCGRCGGSVRVIACIEDQDIIDKILAHLHDKDTPTLPHLAPPTRAPPETLPLFAGRDSSSQSAGKPLRNSLV
jgi:hypothetical protein